jgi:hypothetical protein
MSCYRRTLWSAWGSSYDFVYTIINLTCRSHLSLNSGSNQRDFPPFWTDRSPTHRESYYSLSYCLWILLWILLLLSSSSSSSMDIIIFCPIIYGYKRIRLNLPQWHLYLECVHHNVDSKLSCCAEYVAISCMQVGKKNINKIGAWIYMLYDAKIVIEWCMNFLYRALYGSPSSGNGDYVRNQVHGSRVCVFFVGALVGVGNPFFNKWNRVWITE